jgi:hypothetical protein
VGGYLHPLQGVMFGETLQTALDPKQIASPEALLISQVAQQEALTRLLIMKGLFTKEEFLEMVKMVDKEMKRDRR